MRKIDAVLLSALILYDYSAQSLVDNDAISFGKSFITSKFHDNKLTDPEFEFTPEFSSEAGTAARGVKRLSTTINHSDRKNSNISYFELANLSPEPSTEVTDATEPSVTINHVGDAAENSSGETFTAETAVAGNLSFSQARVVLKENNYSAITEMSASTITEHVADVADMSTFDSDNDGTYDAEDKCPGLAGVARFEGCPVPDSDADGVNDENDRCPTEKGSTDNYGCPFVAIAQPDTSAIETQVQETNENARYAFMLSFQPGNKILSTDDFNIVLQLVDILTQKPTAKVEIEGNTAKTNKDIETPVEKLVHYFRELGVKDTQLIIKTKTLHINSSTESNKLYMRLTI